MAIASINFYLPIISSIQLRN